MSISNNSKISSLKDGRNMSVVEGVNEVSINDLWVLWNVFIATSYLIVLQLSQKLGDIKFTIAKNSSITDTNRAFGIDGKQQYSLKVRTRASSNSKNFHMIIDSHFIAGRSTSEIGFKLAIKCHSVYNQEPGGKDEHFLDCISNSESSMLFVVRSTKDL